MWTSQVKVSDLTNILKNPIFTVEQAKAWITELVRLDLDWHMDDGPGTQVFTFPDRLKGVPVFSKAAVCLLEERQAEVWNDDFNWGRDGCPNGMVLKAKQRAGQMPTDGDFLVEMMYDWNDVNISREDFNVKYPVFDKAMSRAGMEVTPASWFVSQATTAYENS